MKQTVFCLTLSLGLFAASCGNKPTTTDNGANTTATTGSTTTTTTTSNTNTATTPKFETFTSEEGKYSISFPGTPKEQREKIPIKGLGESEMIMQLHETSDGQKAYMVAFNDYPEKLIKEATKDKGAVSKLVHEAQKGVVNSQNLTVSDEKEIDKGGHKGVFFKASNAEFFTAYEIFLVNNRLYQVGIMSKSAVDQADIDAFIGSFEMK